MQGFDSDSLLSGKDEEARVQIAQRVGQRLAIDALSKTDQQGAELLAYQLAEDAIERVRCELSKAIRHAKHLPRPLALKLAHDVDSVSCPFLEVTAVFSDSDWQQLLFTISRGARVAVARRSPMPETIANSLLELGDSVVAETLIENPAAPMTQSVCQALLSRFESEIWILDQLALRDDLITEIAVKLTARVSAAVRDKLVTKYKLPGYTEPLVDDAETAAVLQIIKKTPEEDLITVVETLKEQGKLNPPLLLTALRGNQLEFLEAALSVLAERSLEHVRSVIRRAGLDAVTQLLKRARIPDVMHNDFWEELKNVRQKHK